MKNHVGNEAGSLVPDLQVASTLVLIYFGGPRLEHAVKTNWMKFKYIDREICLILFFLEMGLGLVSTPRPV